MVIVALDILTLNQTIERRVLIVYVCDEGVTILGIAETRTYAVLHAAAVCV